MASRRFELSRREFVLAGAALAAHQVLAALDDRTVTVTGATLEVSALDPLAFTLAAVSMALVSIQLAGSIRSASPKLQGRACAPRSRA